MISKNIISTINVDLSDQHVVPPDTNTVHPELEPQHDSGSHSNDSVIETTDNISRPDELQLVITTDPRISEVLFQQFTHQSTNTHHMLTRAKYGIKELRIYFAAQSIPLPRTFKEALKHEGYKSMKSECDALIKNNTGILICLPANKKISDNKWLFRVKELSDGALDKLKARGSCKGQDLTFVKSLIFLIYL